MVRKPVSFGTSLDQMAPTPHSKHTKYRRPCPRLRFQNEDLEDPGCLVFSDVFPSPKDALHLAIHKVLSILYSSYYSASPDGKSDDADRPWQEVRSITVRVLRDGPGLAATSGLPLDSSHKTIEFDSQYPLALVTSGRLHDELTGVLVHEMVHCWQHDGKGTCPGGLVEGIADFVRLRAGYAPPHWKKERSQKWDAGYQTTGYFLDYLEQTRGDGTVERINLALRERYNKKTFWKELLGSDVDELWTAYQKTLPKKEKDPEDGNDPDDGDDECGRPEIDNTKATSNT